MIDNIEVIGLHQAQQLFNPSTYAHGWQTGLQRAGQEVEGEMKHEAKTHHDTGNLEQQIHTSMFGEGFHAETHIGIDRSLAPEGRPLAFGWKSESGKQPPSQAIAEWLTRHPSMGASPNVTTNAKGFTVRIGTVAEITSEAAVRSRAFLIARAIGRRGYTFGKDEVGGQHHDWFHLGIEHARPRLAGIVKRYFGGGGSHAE